MKSIWVHYYLDDEEYWYSDASLPHYPPTAEITDEEYEKLRLASELHQWSQEFLEGLLERRMNWE
jgi:hypothetical protein